MNSVWTRRALTAFLLAVLVICGMLLYRLWMERVPPGTVSGEALIGGPFELTDQDGNKVTDQTYKGKLMLIYFGFTFCPDACPTALGVMSAALDKLDVAADRVVPILITVDPERDTPPVLKDYVSNFHPRMVGLTGTPEQTAQVAKAYRVFYQKVLGRLGRGLSDGSHAADLSHGSRGQVSRSISRPTPRPTRSRTRFASICNGMPGCMPGAFRVREGLSCSRCREGCAVQAAPSAPMGLMFRNSSMRAGALPRSKRRIRCRFDRCGLSSSLTFPKVRIARSM